MNEKKANLNGLLLLFRRENKEPKQQMVPRKSRSSPLMRDNGSDAHFTYFFSLQFSCSY